MHVQPRNEMPQWLIAGDSTKISAQECKCSATTLNALSSPLQGSCVKQLGI